MIKLPKILYQKDILLFIVISIFFTSSSSLENEEENQTFPSGKKILRDSEENSLVIGLIRATVNNEEGESKSESENESVCFKDLGRILGGLQNKDEWALKVIDSSGKMEPLFMWGNKYWLGSERACRSASSAVKLRISDDYIDLKTFMDFTLSPIPVNYRVLYANISSKMQRNTNFFFEHKLHVGLCLPTSCSDENILYFTQQFFDNYEISSLFEMNVSVEAINDLRLKDEFFIHPFFLISCTVLAVVVALSCLAILSEKSEDGAWYHRFISCFSVRQNYENVMSTKCSPNSITCLNGFRAFGCLMILIFHVGNMTFTDSSEILFFMKYYNFGFQLLLHGVLGVEIFFTISGLLLVYNFLNNDQLKEQIEKNSFFANSSLYFRHICHRYIRLTPVLVITMLSSQLVFNYVTDVSIFSATESLGIMRCDQTWWRNLLYIQNFSDVEEISVMWSWYLACEMQFYAIFLLLLFIFVKYPKINVVKVVYCLLTVVVVAIASILAYLKHFTFDLDRLEITKTQLYIPPWTRVPPYLAGMLVGWLLYHFQNTEIKIKHFYNITFWVILALSVLSTIVGQPLSTDLPLWITAISLPLMRYLIGLMLGGAILLCHYQQADGVNRFLSSPLFVRINKMSYSIYLLHPVILILVLFLQEKSADFSSLLLIVIGFGIFALSYMGAIICSVCFEQPFQMLSDKFILKRKSIEKNKP